MSMRWTTVSDRDFTLMRDEFGNYSHSAEKLWLQFKTSLVKYTAKRVTKGKNVFITEPRGGILTRNRSRLFPFSF